jgi:Ca-activated chloride channel family protein
VNTPVRKILELCALIRFPGFLTLQNLLALEYLHVSRVLIGLLLLVSQDTLQIKVSLVSVGVRVTDSRGRNVVGLKTEDFSVFDNRTPQKIEFFASEEQAITLGILLDHSSSMAFNAKLERAKESARDLVRATRDGSEYFYIPFDEEVRVAEDFTTDRQKIESAIQLTSLGGGTALYDAVVQGVALSKKARLPRQALVIISDGADQHSQYNLQEILSIVRESEVQVYTIGYFDPAEEAQYKTRDKTITLIDGREIDNPQLVLNDLARESGGVAFFPKTDAELAKAVEEITRDIRAQYTLAFYPQSDDGGYHQLRVTVRGGRYTVRARPGYGNGDIPVPSPRRDNLQAFESKVERRNGRMFYHDDFSDRSSGWPNRVTAKYVRGGYQLSGNNVVATNGPVFRDFRASATVSLTAKTGGGLIFRQNDENYFVLAAFPGSNAQPGSLEAFRVDAKGTIELDRWPLIKTVGPVKLEVRCQKDACGIYQQESLRGRLKNVTAADGRIGLCLIGRGDAVFTDVSAEETQ